MTALRTALSAAGLSAAFAFAAVLAPAAPGAAQAVSQQGLSNPQSELVDNLPPQNWLNAVERTEKGHRNGNPDAQAHLIEFLSYTCSHCADFAKQGDSTLDVAAVGPGYVSVEVRPVIRNALDMVVSLLVQCGEPEQFKRLHRSFLYSQGTWLDKAERAPQSQKSLWNRDTASSRVSAASALGLYDVMRANGFSDTQTDRCLRDDAKAQEISANDQADREAFAITGTPTFALDGETLTTVADWPSLARTLQDRFRPAPRAQILENGRVTTVDQ